MLTEPGDASHLRATQSSGFRIAPALPTCGLSSIETRCRQITVHQTAHPKISALCGLLRSMHSIRCWPDISIYSPATALPLKHARSDHSCFHQGMTHKHMQPLARSGCADLSSRHWCIAEPALGVPVTLIHATSVRSQEQLDTGPSCFIGPVARRLHSHSTSAISPCTRPLLATCVPCKADHHSSSTSRHTEACAQLSRQQVSPHSCHTTMHLRVALRGQSATITRPRAAAPRQALHPAPWHISQHVS